MINHVRTLLLNLPASATAAYSPVYVDPAYTTVSLPPWLADVDGVLIPSTTIASRVAVVDALCAVAGVAELRQYFERIDPRCDEPATRERNPVVRLCRTSVPPDGVRIVDIHSGLAGSVAMASRISRLFSSDEVDRSSNLEFGFDFDFSKDMRELARIHSDSTERTLQLGSLVLAFAYQIELERIKAGGSPA